MSDWYHFYAECNGRVYKVRSEYRPHLTVRDEVNGYSVVDVLTGVSGKIIGCHLREICGMEAIAIAAGGRTPHGQTQN